MYRIILWEESLEPRPSTINMPPSVTALTSSQPLMSALNCHGDSRRASTASVEDVLLMLFLAPELSKAPLLQPSLLTLEPEVCRFLLLACSFLSLHVQDACFLPGKLLSVVFSLPLVFEDSAGAPLSHWRPLRGVASSSLARRGRITMCRRVGRRERFAVHV